MEPVWVLGRPIWVNPGQLEFAVVPVEEDRAHRQGWGAAVWAALSPTVYPGWVVIRKVETATEAMALCALSDIERILDWGQSTTPVGERVESVADIHRGVRRRR